MNIKGRPLVDFDIVELEAININSNYADFVHNCDTPIDVFGRIIVCRDAFDIRREIITGKYIPCIETIYNYELNITTIKSVPKTPYRAKIINTGCVTQSQIDKYFENNNNQMFKDYLKNFIKYAKYCQKNNFVKKLKKK